MRLHQATSRQNEHKCLTDGAGCGGRRPVSAYRLTTARPRLYFVYFYCRKAFCPIRSQIIRTGALRLPRSRPRSDCASLCRCRSHAFRRVPCNSTSAHDNQNGIGVAVFFERIKHCFIICSRCKLLKQNLLE